jgi:hypothetical protein
MQNRRENDTGLLSGGHSRKQFVFGGSAGRLSRVPDENRRPGIQVWARTGRPFRRRPTRPKGTRTCPNGSNSAKLRRKSASGSRCCRMRLDLTGLQVVSTPNAFSTSARAGNWGIPSGGEPPMKKLQSLARRGSSVSDGTEGTGGPASSTLPVLGTAKKIERD